jgi:hypothetical protein
MAAHLRLVTPLAEDEDEMSPADARRLAALLRKVAQLGPAELLRMAAKLDRMADG